MNTETVRLEVPDQAIDELEKCTNDDNNEHGEACVRAIAAPVVIAELRRLAANPDVAGALYSRALNRRADELEAGQ
jgi:hypothetical protein